jgi:FAD:protein FMN transferase
VRIVRRSFRAMGTDVTLVAPAETDPTVLLMATDCIQGRFAHEEERFSRFRADSELSHVNAAAGEWTAVSPDFARLTRFAIEGAWRTGGRFDPTVLHAMIAAGYDRDFDDVLAGARGALHPPIPCGRFAEIELEADRLRMPEGVALDFGGVAKGWTVDLAAEDALSAGLRWAIVNAGGDLRLAGDVPATGVQVSVEDPQDRSSELLRLSISEGALATSSVLVRSWGPGLHQLIDPRTGAPSDGDVLQATVWAETCAEAEVRSKWALLEGPSFLERAHAVLVMRDGRLVMNLERAASMAASA